MRIVKCYDSAFKLVGIGLQWGKPLTIIVRDMFGRNLGAMVNFGRSASVKVVGEPQPETRTLMPVCDDCKENHAVLWCVTHSRYVCDACIAANPHPVDGCHWWSLAAKRERDNVSQTA